VVSWRRINADAEGLVDLAAMLPQGSPGVAFAVAPIASPTAQEARLVLDSPAEVAAWLDGKPVTLERSGGAGPFSARVQLPEGPSTLLLRVPAARNGSAVPLVTTIVAPQAVGFSAGESGLSASVGSK
jgi:hypothetical protein